MKQQLKLLLGPLLVVLIAKAASYVLNISLAQVVDTKTYGTVAYGLTLAGLLSAFINLGGTGNARRFLTGLLRKNDTDGSQKFIVWHISRIRLPLAISMLIAIIIFFIMDPLDYYFFKELNKNLHLIAIICVLGPLYAGLGVISSYLLCANRVILSQFVSNIIYNVLFLAVVIFYIMLEYSFESGILPVSFHIIFLQVITLLIGALLLKIFAPRVFDAVEAAKNKRASSNKEWNISARAMYIMSILLTVSARLDFLMVGLLISNSKSLAYYFAAQSTCGFIMMFPSAFFIAISTEISQALKNAKTLAAFLPKWRLCIFVNLCCVCALSAFLWLDQDLIPIMFGSTYHKAYELLAIMLIGYIAKSAISIPYSNLLACSGQANTVSKVLVARLALFVLLVAILVPIYGITGIAIAYSAAECLRAALMIILNHRTTSVRPFFVI